MASFSEDVVVEANGGGSGLGPIVASFPLDLKTSRFGCPFFCPGRKPKLMVPREYPGREVVKMQLEKDIL